MQNVMFYMFFGIPHVLVMEKLYNNFSTICYTFNISFYILFCRYMYLDEILIHHPVI